MMRRLPVLLSACPVLREHEAIKLQREVAELKGKLAEKDKKEGSSTIILGRGGFGLVRQDEYPVGPDGEEVYTPVAVKTVYNNRDVSQPVEGEGGGLGSLVWGRGLTPCVLMMGVVQDCMREGEIMEKLGHPNIPVVHDYYLERE